MILSWQQPGLAQCVIDFPRLLTPVLRAISIEIVGMLVVFS